MFIMHEKWMDSEYITKDDYGWHISKDAPKDLKDKFDEFMAAAENKPILIKKKK